MKEKGECRMTWWSTSLLLALSLSADAFLAAFAYGGEKIRIPAVSVWVIDGVCSGILCAFLLIGALLKPFLPEKAASLLSFLVLLALGLSKLFDGLIRRAIRKSASGRREISFSLFRLRCVLTLYADPEEADADHSKVISPGEAAALAAALSLDGAAVGFGASLSGGSPWAILLFFFLCNGAAVLGGAKLGNKLAGALPFDLTALSGGVLLFLAALRLK